MEDWKGLFSPTVLKRGFDLYRYGSVGEITEDRYNSYSTTVEGNDGYFVSLTLRNGKVCEPSCSCAYAQNAVYCKHLAAMLYKIYDDRGKTGSSKKETGAAVQWKILEFEDDGKPHYLSFGSTLSSYKLTRGTYHKAEEIIAKSKVHRLETAVIDGSGEKYLKYISRVVDGDGELADVTILLGHCGIKSITCWEGGSSYYYYSAFHKYLTPQCRCEDSDKSGKIELCAHKTAALLDLFAYLRENRDIIDYSDDTATRFINSFRKEKKSRAVVEEGDSTVMTDIEPSISGSEMSLKITNEDGKYYKVRDTERLYLAYNSSKTYSLAKNCTIDFSSARLTPRAEKIMELLRFEESEILMYRDYGHYSSGAREKNCVHYTDYLDEFFSIMKDAKILYEDKPLLGFREKEPSFTMRIDELKDSGCTVGITVSGTITGKYRSRKYIYWFQDGYLNRTSLRSLGSASAFAEVASPDGTFSFNIGKNLIENFYQRVLPDLRRFGKVEDNAVDAVEGIVEEPPTSIFYVDIEKYGGIIICQPALRYDSREVRILPKTNEWNSYIRNKNPKWNAFEDDVRETLDEIFTGPLTGRGEWTVPDNNDSLFDFLHSGLQKLMFIGEVHVTEEVRRIVLKKMPPVKSMIDIDENDESVLNFTLDLQGLSVEELVAILQSYRDRKKYYRLKNGDFISLYNTNLDSLSNLFIDSGLPIKDFTEGKMNLPLYRALYLDQILKEQNGVTYEGGQRLRRLIKEFKTISESDYEVPSSLDGTMRSYQKDGYRWMRVLLEHGFGGILADDMGLGKTIQALSLLLALKEEGKSVNALIVSPASLVYNWKAECTKFTPSLNAVTVTGTAKEREHIIKGHDKYDILITSYDLLKRDIALYENASFNIEIIDEAQFIKNHNTAQAKAVRAVKSTHRLALTGTPIENRLSELWSIFEYLMPGFLFSQESFKKLLSNPIEKNGDREAAERLRKLTGPFILRRLKSDVLKDLPEKTEETRVTPLQGEQLRLYTAEVAKAKGMLKGSDNYNEKKIEILAELMRIREICCDPALVFQDYRGESAKREAVMDLIVSAIDGAHKILLFSQFTSMLELLEKDLGKEGISYYKITGDTGKAKRLELVDAFNSGTVPLFLISLKAGGTGLNLTAADIVIHYDPWWNTAVQNQATDRAHRIGQTKRVTVYKMIAENTIEEKIMRLQETKKNLADEIVSTENISLSTLSKEDLMDLLSISKME